MTTKAHYASPSIRTTVPPRVALDIDKPCSFTQEIIDDLKVMNRSQEDLRDHLSEILDSGGDKIDAKTIDSIRESLRLIDDSEEAKKRILEKSEGAKQAMEKVLKRDETTD